MYLTNSELNDKYTDELNDEYSDVNDRQQPLAEYSDIQTAIPYNHAIHLADDNDIWAWLLCVDKPLNSFLILS